jgi:speckle-type POZ protein
LDQKDEAKVPDTNLVLSDIARMLSDEIFVDFTLKSSDGDILKAHKSVLAARSPVFFAMLKSDMQEASESIVSVPDINAKVLKELLRFIYSGAVENLDEVSRELIYAAEKYQIEYLKQICIKSIVASMKKENVAESLLISERIVNSERILNKCAEVLYR